MNHLSFDVICRIADGDIPQSEIELYLIHLKSCQTCQKEVELQKSIVRISQKIQLVKPSINFTQNVLNDVIPSKKKKWYEWILNNMGNVIAMALALAFFWYAFSFTDAHAFKNNSPTKIEPVIEFVKIIQIGSQQLSGYLTPKIHPQNVDVSHSQTITFALLAIVLLVIIDRIAGHFFHRIKANL